jgi:hypothetical protein
MAADTERTTSSTTDTTLAGRAPPYSNKISSFT